MPTYKVVTGHGEDIRVIIPPHVTAVLSVEAEYNPSQRDQHILSIAARGRLGWQEETDYAQRALVETAMGRYKAIIGPCLRARSFSGQNAEAAVGVAVLNRILETNTFYPLQLEEGWAGKRRPTTDNALWLKPRWADTKPSSALACERKASPASRPKRLSPWPSSMECSTRAAWTLSVVLTSPLKLAGKRVARPSTYPCNNAAV